MRVLTGKTGRGQLIILSALAENPNQKQSEIVESTSLTKGAVSNNVRKLKEKSLVKDQNDLELNLDRIIELYREHLESFLTRYSTSPEELNELKTETKKSMDEIIGKEEVENRINQILSLANQEKDLQSLNSVFKEVDRLNREVSDILELQMLGIITDRSNLITDNDRIREEAKSMLQEVKQQ